jgi:uncharacterized membrane protein
MKQSLVKTKAFATSFIFPYVILLHAVLIYVGIDIVSNSAWNPDEGKGMDTPAVFLMFYYLMFGIFGTCWALVQTEDGEKLYKKKLKNSKYSIPKRSIVADLNDRTGEVLIYEESKSITGNEKKLLNTFDTDDEDIHQYVAEQREKITGPDLGKAKAIVQTINGE